MKNKIVLYVGCHPNKQKIVIEDFTSLKHEWVNERSYVTIIEHGKVHHYGSTITAISEIEIYD